MKKLTVLLSVTVLLFLTGCSKKPIYKSAWQSHELKAGEFDNGWYAEMQYNSKARMLYGVSNDNKNLYVRLRVTDPTVKRKIMFTGLTYWIKLNNNNDDQMELTFPIKQSNQIDRGKMAKLINDNSDGKSNKSDMDKFNLKYLNGMSELAIIGFDGEKESRLLGNKSSKGINAILSTDSLHTLFYEVQIPLDMIFDNPAEFMADSTNYFSYGFETGYLKMPTSPQGGKSGGMGGKGGGKGGGRKGGGGGGQQSGANSERMAAMQEMSQPSKFSVKKVSLSTAR